MSRGRAHSRRQFKFWLAGLGLVVVLIAIVVATATYYFRREPELNKETLCPAGGPSGHIVLLVDKTDPLTFIQANAFHTFLENLITHDVPVGNLLSVFALGDDYSATAKPLFELCNPGSEQGQSEFTHTLSFLKKQFERQFRDPMLLLESELRAKQSAKQSPIFEMLQLVSINGFQKQNVKGPRRLIIVSDMLHNTPQYSMYQGNMSFEEFRKTDYGRKLYTDLKGVQVEVIYLVNTPHLQTRRHIKFWEDFFEASGAQLKFVRPLEG
jgi:hypothetical protein